MSDEGWIGFDLDGTLAEYDTWRGIDHIGAPVPAMIEEVKRHLGLGRQVRILTARMSGRTVEERVMAELAIKDWCIQHIGVGLPVTNEKDYGMWALYDDRAIAVEKNTGRVLGGELP